MSCPADIIRKLLVDAGLGTMPIATGTNGAWPIYVNHYPDLPDEQLYITETQPILDGREQRTGRTVLHPGISLIVKARDPSVGYAKLEAIATLFDTVHLRDVTIAPTTYRLWAVSHRGIIPLEQEPDKRRYKHSLNAVMTYEPVAV